MATTIDAAPYLDESPGEDLSAPRPFAWTRALYHQLGELGILHEDHRVELMEGELIQMAAQKPSHSVAVGLAQDALTVAFGVGFHVRGQAPIGLGDRSEPEPDLAVLAGSRRDYRASHPHTAALVVEVADSSLRYDRARKGSLYARFGVPEFWIINLQERVLEVYREAVGDHTARYGARYSQRLIVEADGGVSPLAAPGREVKVADLLP